MVSTFSGLFVNPLVMRVDEVDIRDIAHALACCNRFAGHTTEPISVAQHSVYVSRLCSMATALQGLLHDASEAYLHDVTKWVKETPQMAAYRAAEDRLQRVIMERFGCSPYLAPDVRSADKLMVRYEYQAGYGRPIAHPDYPSISEAERQRVEPWEPWPWRAAEAEFLRVFEELREERGAR